MKNMLKLMNMTCRSAISQIILLFLCVLLAEGTWLFLQLKNIELLYYHDMGINIMIILIGFILLLWIQVKRFTHFAKSGGLTPMSCNCNLFLVVYPYNITEKWQ